MNTEEIEHLRADLEQLKQRGQLTPALKRVHARLPTPVRKPGAADAGAGAV